VKKQLGDLLSKIHFARGSVTRWRSSLLVI